MSPPNFALLGRRATEGSYDVEPRQISLAPVLIGCGLDILVFGIVLGTGVALVGQGRGAKVHSAAVLCALLGALHVALDIHAAQRILTRNQGTVIAGFGSSTPIEEPIAMRVLCALTAIMALPMCVGQLVALSRRTDSIGLLLLAAMTTLIACSVGIVASVLRAGDSDPGWATHDNSIVHIMQLIMYAAFTLVFTISGTAQVAHHRKQHRARYATDDVKTSPYLTFMASAALPAAMALVLLFTSLLCEDYSIPLIVLMPMGNVCGLVLLSALLVVARAKLTAPRDRTPSSPLSSPVIAPHSPSSSALLSSGSQYNGHDSSMDNVSRHRLASCNSSIMPTFEDNSSTFGTLSVRKMSIDLGTPNFLRTDPYAIALPPSPLSSPATSPSPSLRRPSRTYPKMSATNNHRERTMTERSSYWISSPLSRSVSMFDDTTSYETGGKLQTIVFVQEDSVSEHEAIMLDAKPIGGDRKSDVREERALLGRALSTLDNTPWATEVLDVHP